MAASDNVGVADATVAASAVMDVDACVAAALQTSAVLEEGEAQVQRYVARLEEIEAVYYPKLSATTFVAPVFSVHGDGFTRHVERRYKTIADWGPYTSLEVLLSLPMYTFGRAEAGQTAARARIRVERARVREAGNKVALEARRFYYLHLFAKSILPALYRADAILVDAKAAAQHKFEMATGEVTQVDLAKLSFGAAEVGRYIMTAQQSGDLALQALKHTMGRPQHSRLQLADDTLPEAQAECVGDQLPTLLEQAALARPEWEELAEGKKAAVAWEKAERLANWPAIFVAGTFSGAYTPNHDADENPWHLDIYNRYVGGVAAGLKFDVDPAQARAKAHQAVATAERVEAMQRFAHTGIALQVRQAHDTMHRHHAVLNLTRTSVGATRRWMGFAANAYMSGVGEARDVLEGLAAYLQAKRTHLETLQAFWVARAELTYAVGQH